MRPRVLIFLLFSVAAIVALMFWSHSMRTPVKDRTEQNSVESLKISRSTQTQSVVTDSRGVNKGSSNSPLARKRVPEVDEAQFTREFVKERNVRVSFFGRCVDQETNPVAGVHLKIDVWQEVSLSSPKNEISGRQIVVELTSGADGRFELNKQEGDSIYIQEIQKDGYEVSPSTSRNYAPIMGSYEDPVVFRLWKYGEKARLINGSKFWRVVPDGRVYTVDLLRGSYSESAGAMGDLRISVSRPAGVTRSERYDWSFEVTPLDGGILPTADEFLYTAPRSGYQPQYFLGFRGSDPKWTDEPKIKFYIQSHGGKAYARVYLQVYAKYQNAAVLDIGYAVNPNGSTNLQP